jgi:WbqC-like protein family
MTVVATTYFPTCAYVKTLCKNEEVVMDLGEHYVKQTLRNRCSILTSLGVQNLSIPVIRPNGNKSITKDILVSDEVNWRRDHWRTIKAAYSSAPYFEHYGEEVERLIFQRTPELYKFNINILNQIKNWLTLPFEIQLSATYIESTIVDKRSFIFDSIDQSYLQIFSDNNQFYPNLSILDALFCLGPMARNQIIEPLVHSNQNITFKL